MTGNLIALVTTWQTLPPGPTTQKLVAINSIQVLGPPQDITIAELNAFLVANNLLDSITAYVATGINQQALIGCNYLLATLAGAPTITTSIPANFNAVQTIGQGLLADPATGVTLAQLEAVIALICPLILWWQANGFAGPITVTELIAAGELY